MTTDKTAQIVISGIVVGAFVGITVGWIVKPPLVENSQILSLLTGALTAAFGQIISYWLKSPGSGGTP